MAAPALVALAPGSRDSRHGATIRRVVAGVRAQRPGLRIEPAFCSSNAPDLTTAVSRLAASGHEEVVVVPLLLDDGPTTRRRRPGRRRRGRGGPPGRSASARPRSSASSRASSSVLDERMREALRPRVRELDALVLAADGSSDHLANQAVARLARLWGTRHKLPVTAAFASTAPPATGEAVRAFRDRGTPPRRGRLAVPGTRPPARPGRGAGLRGRRRRRRPSRSGTTPRSRARSSPATPSAPSSSSPSEPVAPGGG